VVATGTPEDVAAVKSSFTGQYLKPYLLEKAKLPARKLVKKKAKATKPRAPKRATA
jgi:excinuclease ABC subunit A